MRGNPPPDEYRCAKWTEDQWYRASEQCRSRHRVLINKKKYCKKHGAIIALRLALKSGAAKKTYNNIEDDL